MQLGLIDNYVVWLGDPDKTMLLIANAFVWKQMPLAAILLLVTMKSIPEDLYNAAKVDGANVLQRFLHVTLPSLRPGFMLVLIYETMISIRHFDLFLILTQGGPGDASHVLAWQIYVETFRNLASAPAPRSPTSWRSPPSLSAYLLIRSSGCRLR